MAESSDPSIVTAQHAEQTIAYSMVQMLNTESSWPRGLERLCSTIRDVVAMFVRNPTGLRTDIRTRLPKLLDDVLALPARGGRREAMLTFAFDRRGFHIDAVPVLDTVPEHLVYGLALLLDSRRDFSHGLRQCVAPRQARHPTEDWDDVARCSRFFWRRYRRQRYCSPKCTHLATREVNCRRMQRHRAPRQRLGS
jgi:hypothetical protein